MGGREKGVTLGDKKKTIFAKKGKSKREFPSPRGDMGVIINLAAGDDDKEFDRGLIGGGIGAGGVKDHWPLH